MKEQFFIKACSGRAIDVKKGQWITVTDLEGGQVVDFFAECALDPGEFLSPGVTIDVNESLKLHVGDSIYSNLYRPLLKILADDVGEHDLLHPCCRREMYDFFYRNGEGHPTGLNKITAGLNAPPPNIHPDKLFNHTESAPAGIMPVRRPLSAAGDRIVLRAETDLRLGIAACSVSESDCNGGKCSQVAVLIQDPDEALP